MGSTCAAPSPPPVTIPDRRAPHTGHSLPRQPPPREITRGPADRRPRAAGTDHHDTERRWRLPTMSLRGRGPTPAYQKTTRPERPLLWAGDSTRGQLEGATIHELAGVFRVTDRGAPPIIMRIAVRVESSVNAIIFEPPTLRGAFDRRPRAMAHRNAYAGEDGIGHALS